MNKEDEAQAAARAKEKAVIAEVKRHRQEVAAQKVSEGRAPYEVLGRDGKEVVLYSRDFKGLAFLSSMNLSPTTLLWQVATDEALKAWNPEWENLSPRELCTAVVKDVSLKLVCRIYSPRKVRGAGIWLDAEGAIHSTGQDCYLQRDGDSEAHPIYPMRPDGTLYATDSPKADLPIPAEKPLTNEEGRALYDFFAARTWEESYAPDFVMGWLACSLLGGLLPVRPHLWINGAKGNGKSALRRDMQRLLGGFCHSPSGGETTPTSVRRLLGGNALPLLFDESETNGKKFKKENIEKLCSLARLSFDGDQEIHISKEGIGTRAYILRSCFCLLSIRDFLESEADYDRFYLLHLNNSNDEEIRGLEKRRIAGEELLSRTDTPSRFIARLMQQTQHILSNSETIAKRLRGKGVAGRRATMAGVLLACRWAVTDGGEPTENYLSRCDALVATVEQQAQAECRPEWEKALDIIMSHPCMTYPMKKNVRQATQAVFWPRGDDAGEAVNLAEAAKSALKSLGIHPRQVDARRKDARAGQMHVIIEHNGQAFAVVLRGSQYDGGHGIPAAIKGAPHAEVKNVFLNGTQTTRLLIYEDAFREDDD